MCLSIYKWLLCLETDVELPITTDHRLFDIELHPGTSPDFFAKYDFIIKSSSGNGQYTVQGPISRLGEMRFKENIIYIGLLEQHEPSCITAPAASILRTYSYLQQIFSRFTANIQIFSRFQGTEPAAGVAIERRLRSCKCFGCLNII